MTSRNSFVATALSCLSWACTSQAVDPAPAAPGSTVLSPMNAVAAARADAAQRLGLTLTPGALEVISAESVTWPDGSLGCPRPGFLYPQALVPGYRVQLQGPTGALDYHASVRGALVLCPPGRSQAPLLAPIPDDLRS